MLRVFNNSERKYKQLPTFRSKKIALSGSYSNLNLRTKENKIPQSRILVRDDKELQEELYSIKQQNQELKEIVKVLKTQIQFQKEQQQRNAKKEENYQDYKLLKSKISLLLEKNYNLKSELEILKKSVKTTQIQQLQTQLQQYKQEIARLKLLIKSMKIPEQPVHQLNQIIQKQYLQNIKIQELENVIEKQKEQIRNQERNIRKLKIATSQKIKEIKNLEAQLLETQKKNSKKDDSSEIKLKNQLECQKKKGLFMEDTIVALQKKFLQYQARIKQMKQHQIEIVNKETEKRKQLLESLQDLKLQKDMLQDALLNMKKRSWKPRGVSKNLSQTKPSIFQEKQISKKRFPLNVKFQHIKDIAGLLIVNLQTEKISSHQAIKLLSQMDTVIDIKTLMRRLQVAPFNLSEQQAELFTRYILQQEIFENKQQQYYINLQKTQKIQLMISILKQIFNEYPVFSKEDLQSYNIKCIQFEKSALFNIRASLCNRKEKNYRGASQYEVVDILEEINNIVQDKTLIDYIHFKSFPVLAQKLSLESFFEAITQQ